MSKRAPRLSRLRGSVGPPTRHVVCRSHYFNGGTSVFLGKLISINTAIIGLPIGNVSSGFAVLSNMARAVMRQVIRYDNVRQVGAASR